MAELGVVVVDISLGVGQRRHGRSDRELGLCYGQRRGGIGEGIFSRTWWKVLRLILIGVYRAGNCISNSVNCTLTRSNNLDLDRERKREKERAWAWIGWVMFVFLMSQWLIIWERERERESIDSGPARQQILLVSYPLFSAMYIYSTQKRNYLYLGLIVLCLGKQIRLKKIDYLAKSCNSTIVKSEFCCSVWIDIIRDKNYIMEEFFIFNALARV